MPSLQSKRILITGASGFIGSHLVEAALAAGAEVWAAVRASSSRRWLADERIRFVELTLGDEAALRRQLEAHVAQHGPWHFAVHAAGATKCRREADFRHTNTEGTERLARLLLATGALAGRLVFVSSLSVCGPVHEADTLPIAASDEPRPNTAYGRSKLEAEHLLAAMEGLDYVVVRPTGVYGPRERDYYLAALSVRRGVDFAVGLRPQRLTFIYVADLAAAVLAALTRGERGAVYHLSDGCDYSARRFGQLVARELGRRHVLRVTAPLWLLACVCALGSAWAAMTGRAVTLNMDKYRIMRQRSWRCDIGPARCDLGYEPRWPLERGVAETMRWYKRERWI